MENCSFLPLGMSAFLWEWNEKGENCHPQETAESAGLSHPEIVNLSSGKAWLFCPVFNVFDGSRNVCWCKNGQCQALTNSSYSPRSYVTLTSCSMGPSFSLATHGYPFALRFSHFYGLSLLKDRSQSYFFIFYLVYILSIWLFFLRIGQCTKGEPGVHGGQKRLLEPLALELQMIVSRYMGAGNWTQVSGRAAHVLSYWAIFPDPKPHLLFSHAF